MGTKMEKKLLQKLLGESVRSKRLEKNLTLVKLAAMTGLDEKHLGRLERGEKLPNTDTWFKLQAALELSSDVIISMYTKELEKIQ